MVDRVGQQLGNYRLVRLLGHGGYAEVYLGQHVHVASKQAAIKILYLFDVDARKFLQEAEMTEQLVHPHIVRLLDFDLEQGTPFLVLDFAPGGSLRTRHPRGNVVPLATVGAYLKELAPALQYAHDKHILHRDIKPDNILVGRGSELLLSDFGIAVLTQTERTPISSAYGIGGTPFYMAPETYRGKPEKASDQYALAVVVYEWLCGSVPFSGGDFIQLGYQHAHEPVPPLRERNPAISPAVEQVVTTALAKDPKQRFGSVLAFATALEQASQVRQPEPEPDSVPDVPVSETTAANQFQQPTVGTTPVPIITLSQHIVSEVSEETPSQPQMLIPLSGKEHRPQTEEERRQTERVRNSQTHVQANKIEEDAVRKTREAEVAQKAGEEQRSTIEQARVSKPRQEPIPSRFPPSAGTGIPQDLHQRQLSWRKASLLIILTLIILGSGVWLYAAVRISPARTQATALSQSQATARAAANAYARFVATNGIMFGFDAQHSHTNSYEQILNPATVGGLKEKWTYHTEKLNNTGNAIESSPAVVGGVVYVGSWDGNLYALDAATGAKKWAFPTGNNIFSSPAVVDGVVYVSRWWGTMYALNAASGAKKWDYDVGDGIDSSPAVVGGVVYIGSAVDGNLYALDAASGAKKWTYYKGKFNNTGIAIDSSPTVADGVVYIGSHDGNLYVLDAASGAKKWEYDVGDGIASTPAVADGMVYVGSEDGNLYAFHLPDT